MSHFKFALNTSTLFPFELDIMKQISIAVEAGYDGIELWVKDIESYLENGGSMEELRAFIEESGIEVVNAIAFFKWSDVDEQIRKEGLRQAEREMSMLSELGCKAVATPPTGNVDNLSLATIALHFSELMIISQRLGIEPYLEFWGRSKQLSKLSDAIYLAMESGLADVKILLDPFHMYIGESAFESLNDLSSKHIGIVHVNDYPASPEREYIQDRDRVYPGDGIAPLREIKDYLNNSGYCGYLSLELFIEEFGEQTPLMVASYGLAQMKKTFLE